MKAMIGLQRAGGPSLCVELRPGCILGRTRQPSTRPGGGLPPPPSTATTVTVTTYAEDPLRPDLGMTTANAQQVSRHECTVEEVTSTSVTLFIPEKLYGNPCLYKPLIVRKSRPTTTKTRKNGTASASISFSLEGAAPVPSQRFTLYVGDVLIFQTGHGFEDHPFQVVATRPSSSLSSSLSSSSSSSSSSPLLPTRKRSAAPPRIVSHTTNHPKNPKRTTRSVPPPPPLRSSNHHHDNNNEETTKQTKNKKPKTTTTKTIHPVPLLPTKVQWLLPIGATPFRCPFETKARLVPSPPPLPLSSTTIPSHKKGSLPPSKDNQEEGNDDNDNDNDDDYNGNDDDDDDDNDDDPKKTPRDMHTTLGNTLQKALCESTTPTMGATLLHLTTLYHHRLPSRQLCQALIHQSNLLDCGTKDGKERVSLVAQRFILEYFQDAVALFPTLVPQRLATAAGPTAWRTVLELCSCLPPPPVGSPPPKQSRPPPPVSSSSKASRRGTPSGATTSPTEDTKRNDPDETSRRRRHHRHQQQQHQDCLVYYTLLEQHRLALKFLYLVMDGNTHTTGRSHNHPAATATPTATPSARSSRNNTTRENSPPRRRSRRTTITTNNNMNNNNNIDTHGKGKQSSSQPLSSSSSSLLIVEDMREFGGAAACRLAASSMAHILCVLGPDHLLHSQQQQQHLSEAEAEEDNDKEQEQEESIQMVVFHSIASDIMEYLGWMLRFMVQELLLFPSASSTTDNPMKETNVATMLWNTLSSRLDDTSFSSRYAGGSGTRKSHAFTPLEKRNLKIYWLECFLWGRQEEGTEDDIDNNNNNSQQQQQQQPPGRRGMIDMEEILAAKLKITKEYFEHEK